MALEYNKAIAHRFYEIFNEGKIDKYREIVAPDFVDHNAMPGQTTGIAGLIQAMAMFRLGFPGTQYTIHDTVAEGDKVVLRVTGFGRHSGHFLGIPPTGREISFNEIDIFRIVKGKIKEAWHLEDLPSVMMEILRERPGPGA